MIRQARSALIYPTIVLLIAMTVIMLMTVFVLPKMVEFIADFMRGKGDGCPALADAGTHDHQRFHEGAGLVAGRRPLFFMSIIADARWAY